MFSVVQSYQYILTANLWDDGSSSGTIGLRNSNYMEDVPPSPMKKISNIFVKQDEKLLLIKV
jgi:hypothetical protein